MDYIIIMLCKDDERYYTDYVNKVFDKFQKAYEEMNKCIFSELESLGNDFHIEDLGIDTDEETCEMEILDKNNELITRYEVIRIQK